MEQKFHDQMQRELAAAVRAHGGDTYTFFTDDDPMDKEGPLVEATGDSVTAFRALYMVSRVKVTEDGECKVFGYVLEDWNEEEELDSLELEDVQNIIFAIPATETVKSVAEEEEGYEVLRMYPEDIECAGYDATKMTDQLLRTIARAAGKGLGYDFLQAAIQTACDDMNLPKAFKK